MKELTETGNLGRIDEPDPSFQTQADAQHGGPPVAPGTMTPNPSPRHIPIGPTFPDSNVKFGPMFEDLATRSAPDSAVSDKLTYRWR